MANWREVLGGAIAVAGDRLLRFGAQFGQPPPTVNPPGVVRPTTIKNTDPRVTSALNSLDALFGRVATNAGPTHDRWSMYSASDLTPEKIGNALKLADQGNPLVWMDMCEQAMERDGRLGGLALTRAQAVSGATPRIARARVTQDLAQLAESVRGFIDACVAGIDAFDESVEHLLLGNGPGYALCENVYAIDTISFPDSDGNAVPIEAIVPRNLVGVHGKHVRFDLEKDEPLLVIAQDLQSFPFGKFTFFRGEGTGPGPLSERRGYMRSCIWYHLGKHSSVGDWLVWLHRHGLPTVLGKFDGELAQYPEFAAVFEELLTTLGDGRPALVPRDFEVEVTSPSGGGRTGDPHSSMAAFCNTEMVVRIYGAQLAIESGGNGSYAQASVHADVAYRRELADARKLNNVLRAHLFYPLLWFNRYRLAAALGQSPEAILRCVPWIIHRVDREMSPTERNKVFIDAVNEGGVDVDEDQYRDEMNLNAPAPGGRKLRGRAQQVSSGGKVVSTNEAVTNGAEAPVQKAAA